MKKILPYILVLSAISVSLSAAYYSIYGLSKLFSGATTAVIVMAGSLEFAKLLVTVVLHNYWNVFKTWLKIYFTSTVIILMVITSGGIYGFLSNAYQITSTKDQLETKKIDLIELKKETYVQQRDESIKEKAGLIESIEKLRSSLGNNILQSVDKKTGQLITTTSNSNRKTYEAQLQDATSRRNKLSDQLVVINDSISNYEIQIIEIQNNSSVSSELGPLRFISKLTGKSMDIIVNWFLLLLIIVFDPLAIALVLGASSIFNYKNIQIPIVKSEPVTEPLIEELHSEVINKESIAEPDNIVTDKDYEFFNSTPPIVAKEKKI